MTRTRLSALIVLLLASMNAVALDQWVTQQVTTRLVIAGSEGARDAFQDAFAAYCVPGTLNLYWEGLISSGADMRAYSCTLINTAPVPVTLRNTNVAVYYRSAGGAVWAVGSAAKQLPIKRLVVDGNCTLGIPPEFGVCQVNNYNESTDQGTGNLTNALVDIAVSDQDAGAYRGENWGLLYSGLGAEPEPGKLENLSRTTLFGQVFAVLVNNSVPATNISKQDLASIFAGAIYDWGRVQNPQTGDPYPAGQITVCRGYPGMGVQTAAATYFLNQTCGAGSEPSVAAPAGQNGNPVIEASTLIALEACVATHTGSIAATVLRSLAPSGTRFVSVSGVAPGNIMAARGLYDFWYEASSAKRPGLSGDTNALANLLVSRVRHVQGIPLSIATFAIPSSFNPPRLPILSSSRPIAVGTKGGNRCRTALTVF